MRREEGNGEGGGLIVCVCVCVCVWRGGGGGGTLGPCLLDELPCVRGCVLQDTANPQPCCSFPLSCQLQLTNLQSHSAVSFYSVFGQRCTMAQSSSTLAVSKSLEDIRRRRPTTWRDSSRWPSSAHSSGGTPIRESSFLMSCFHGKCGKFQWSTSTGKMHSKLHDV